MKTTDLTQTVIFVCCLIIVPVFIFTYFLYSQTNLKDFEILDKSFSVTVGFFSGVTTLAAAYIASCLYTDWRVQTKYSEQLKNISNIAVKFRKIPSIINNIRSDENNALFLSDCFKYITKKKNSLDEGLCFNIPDFDNINNIIDELTEALTPLSVYSLGGHEDNINAQIYRLKESLNVWILGFNQIKNDFNESNISKINIDDPIDYIYLFCDRSSAFYTLNASELGENYSIYNHNEIDIYHDQIAVSVAIGEFLSNIDKY